MNRKSQDLVNDVRAMASLDVNKQVNMVFMGALRRAIVHRGIASHHAEKIVVRIQVRLESDAFTTEQLNQMAEDYATTLVNIRDAYKAQGFLAADEALVESAAQMSLVG